MSKKSLFADFYMYEFICQYGETNDDILEYNLREEALNFLEEIKLELKEILEYSIMHEISHIWWETMDYDSPTSGNFRFASTGGSRYYVEKHISEDSAIVLQDFMDNFKNLLPNNKLSGVLNGVERGWAYWRIINTPQNVCTFIKDIKKLFTILPWRDNFGGKKWEDICNAYLKLLSAEDYHSDYLKMGYENIFIVIDKIFDLEHNTSTIFNKIPSYKINGSHDWIKEFLDFKRDLKDPWDLYKYCGQSKQIAARKLKKLGFGTKEEKEMNHPNKTNLPADVQQQLDRLDQDNWSLAKGVITNVVDVDVTELNNILHSIDIVEINDQINAAIEKVNNLQEELSEALDSFGDNIDNIGEHIQDVADTFEIKLKDVNDLLIDLQLQHSDAIENMERHIITSTINFEKCINDIKEEIIDNIKTSVASIDSAFVFLHERIDDLERPWYTKVINIFKKLFGK